MKSINTPEVINASDAYVKVKSHEGVEYQCLFCLAFMMSLWIAAFSRLLPRSLRPFASNCNREESFWQEAKRAADTVTGYAFMR